MAVFRVARNYSAVYQSRPIAFAEGATVDVDDATAAWVNRDSPGCLVPVDTPAEEPTPDDTDTEAPADTEAPVEDEAPKRGRRGSA